MTKVTYTSGGSSYDAEYAYDGNARLVNLLDWIDAVDGLEYAYDAAGRLTQLTDYDGTTLDYAYDAAGRVTSMNDYFSHETTYTYTDTGQVSTITAPGSKVWTYAYNALGQPTSVAIPNGMTTAYGYDTRNRLTKIEHKDGATVLDGFTYALDDGGNITTTTHADSSLWDYEYDGRDRLTKAERYDTDGTTLLHRYSYSYDVGDNLLTKAVFDGTNTTTTTFAYTDANEQTGMAVDGTTTTFAYDALGRMTSKGDGTYSATYAYGPVGTLSTVTTDFPSEDDVEYLTGGDGRRRSRTANSVETWYNWDGLTVINEENSAGVLSRTYVGHAMAHIDGTNPATGSYEYYFHDHLGTTRRLRAQDKSSLGAYEYTPFGDSYAEFGTTISAKHAGHDWDPSANLDYAPYRYLMPGVGRWLSRDSLGMVDGPNMYLYARANPTNSFDLHGLSAREFFFGEGFTTSGGNPHMHCVNSCVLAKKAGQKFSKIFMDYGKELFDAGKCFNSGLGKPGIPLGPLIFIPIGIPGYKGSCNSAFQPSDYLDNSRGRWCAKQGCYKDDPQGCRKCCGRYRTGPGTKEGPGSLRPFGPLAPFGVWGSDT